MLHIAMGIGLLAGLLFGILAAATGSPALLAVAEGVRPLGTLFVRGIQMVVIPLVVAVVFSGVARLGDIRKVGRMGLFSVGFFWLTTIPAILIGMGFMTVALRFSPEVTVAGVEAVATPELPGMVDFLLRLIPTNPFAAAAQGALLPLIVFTVLFAAAASTLETADRERLVDLADAVGGAFIKLVYWVLWTGPVGVFGLAAPVTAQTGWAMLQSLAVFVVTVIIGLVVFIALVYLPLVKLVGGMSPSRFLRGSVGTATVGFTTTSSVATLPVMLTESQENLDVSPPIANFTLSLGASINRAGSALFQGASVVFVASIFDVTVPSGAMLGAVVAVFFAAMTVAPVPSASIMTLAPALDAVGAPLAGLGVLLGVDRIPDMFRSATNMLGHMSAAVVVDGLLSKDGSGDGGPDGAGPGAVSSEAGPPGG